MAIVKSFHSLELETQLMRNGKGPLVRVEIRPGQYVKMYRSDAIAAGHIKAQVPEGNKIAVPEDNKQLDPHPEPFDFTVIPGIGPATARVLVARGVTTRDQLVTGDLSFLSVTALQAIKDWLTNGLDND